MEKRKILWYAINFKSDGDLNKALSGMNDILNKIPSYYLNGFKIYRFKLSLYFWVENFGVLLAIKRIYNEIGVIARPSDLSEFKEVWTS